MEDRFVTYTSIHLAAEESFVGWVLHGANDAEWKAWSSRFPESRAKVEEASRLVKALNQVSGPTLSQSGQDELWSRIHTSIQSQAIQPARRNIRFLWTAAMTAAAALALLFWISLHSNVEKVMAQAGEQKTLVLPEESAVTLNAVSKLTYREETFEKDRVLRLDGEAFFKVKPGSTFTVETDYGTVTVLGTSFNVISRNGRFEVSCYTGKVKVESPGQQSVIITPGERSVSDSEQPTLSRSGFALIKETPEWTTGRFVFDNQPLNEVIEELERQYDIRVKLDTGLEDLRYTGLFEAGNLDNALSLITWPLHLKSTIKGKTVTISR